MKYQYWIVMVIHGKIWSFRTYLEYGSQQAAVEAVRLFTDDRVLYTFKIKPK